MSDGYEIPISADLSGLHEAIAKINASIAAMGAQINAALGTSNAALATNENGMRKVAGTASTVAAAQNQLATMLRQQGRGHGLDAVFLLVRIGHHWLPGRGQRVQLGLPHARIGRQAGNQDQRAHAPILPG